MKTQQDSRGQTYTEIENIRVTYIPAKGREKPKNWAGSDVIRVQAKKDSTSNSLHPGAEVPVSSPEAFGELVAAICQVYAEGRERA
jgi:hypothetical protein